MRLLSGTCAILLLGSLGLWGCTEANPAFCDSKAAACPTMGGPDGGEEDLADAPDLRKDDPEGDLRREDPSDLLSSCTDSTDCASKVCLPDGSCAAAGDVIYVNNRGGMCSGDHLGTLVDPVCGTAEAVLQVRRAGKHHVYVFGSFAHYAPLEMDNLSARFYGPGGYAMPAASISGRQFSPAVSIKGGGPVLLDGFDLIGAAAEGVSCRSAGAAVQVEISRSRVRDSQISGVYGQGCKLTIKRSVVYNNGNRGVNSESSGEVLLENTYVLGNRGGGVRMSGGSGKVRSSTLVYNGAIGTLGGVECEGAGGQKLIEGSIVVRNGRAIGGSSISAACHLQRSALDEEGNGDDNRYKANPDFVSLQDFHLRRTANSNACCIDQLDGATTDPRLDFDGTARPQGVRFDIGAHEVK